MSWSPQFCRVLRENGDVRYRLGHELIDAFLEFAAGRARPNTVRAYAHDLKIFFSVVEKDPIDVTPADVFGLRHRATTASARRGERRAFSRCFVGTVAGNRDASFAAVSAFYGYVLARADTPVVTNPVPHGLQRGAVAVSCEAHRWCAACDVCLASSIPKRRLHCSRHYEHTVTEPSCKRCCLAAFARRGARTSPR